MKKSGRRSRRNWIVYEKVILGIPCLREGQRHFKRVLRLVSGRSRYLYKTDFLVFVVAEAVRIPPMLTVLQGTKIYSRVCNNQGDVLFYLERGEVAERRIWRMKNLPYSKHHPACLCLDCSEALDK